MSTTLWRVPQNQHTDTAVDTGCVFHYHEIPVRVPEACDVTSVKIELDPSMDRQP